jgi:hypothetical protein
MQVKQDNRLPLPIITLADLVRTQHLNYCVAPCRAEKTLSLSNMAWLLRRADSSAALAKKCPPRHGLDGSVHQPAQEKLNSRYLASWTATSG